MNRDREKDRALAEEAARAVLQHDARRFHNPVNARCGLEDCDCEYTIGGLLRRLELIAEDCKTALYPNVDTDVMLGYIIRSILRTVSQTRAEANCDSSCPCFQAGYEAERQPVGA